PIHDAPRLSQLLHAPAGVVEHGLFVGLATTLVIAHPGEIEIVERPSA
ncbi:MAG: ribose 5-phosphate isomerase A, partial [Alphaproteobacteria bacterium]|nr:ribose 5-phosphate isomerase A [Alphaproteobacteria bacterium]